MSLFVTVEGGEGSGKTSHITSLSSLLIRHNIKYRLTREPGGTPIGDDIRSILLDTGNTAMVRETELLLYLASRKQHLEEVIKPALEEGLLVICDRYEDSSLIYQGMGREIGIDRVRRLSRLAGIDRTPDLTLLFDVPPDVGLERARGRSLEGITRFENEHLQFHRKVREGFLELAKLESDRYVIFDTTRPFREVEQEVFDTIRARMQT